MDVAGRTAVITGASRGLGAGLAEAFHGCGMQLALCSRSAPALAEGERVMARCVDVVDAEAVSAFAEEAAVRFGRLDLWINNAGVLDPIQPLRDLDPGAARQHLDVNVMGTLLGCQAYLRQVRRQAGGGVLVNISSGAARKPYAGWSVYCAAKAAVDRLTECIDVEERDGGLRAYAVAPGVVDTAMQAQIRASRVEDFPERERFVAMKRDGAFSSPAFVAERILELAFDPAHRPDGVLVRLPSEPAG
ncbi:MAG: short-chain dehydrogenase [Deltaproteobacteria bacterium]|jgi:NAD(P)-dependent dehydrogenase (short-subunit alcohol dehydrogenase family)|nr:short-chain dehydrogenase [Deltaproteobacteria bacterium]